MIFDNNQELITAIEAIITAGKILKKNFNEDYQVIRKSPKEMVSVVDMQSQEIISKILKDKYPDYGIITEEKRLNEVTTSNNWIIDPIDGTHNYIAGLPFSGISIGLMKENEFYLGVIYLPIEDNLFYAVKGKGAYCNGRAIYVSHNQDLSKSIINYDNQFYLAEKAFDYYKLLTQQAFTTRIFGVATRDLCFIASGKIDGRIWNSTKICDIAAGIVILTEAGGKITNFDGSPCNINSKSVVASNGHVHNQLLNIFNEKNL